MKKRLWHKCFPVNLAKSLRTTLFTKHLWWLASLNICFSFYRNTLSFCFTLEVEGVLNLIASYLHKKF